MPADDSLWATLEALAARHAEAWETLGHSVAAVADLPRQTLATLVGAAPAPGPAAEGEAPATEALAMAQAAAEAARWRADAEASRAAEVLAAYQALERASARRADEAVADLKQTVYRSLEPFLTQWPLVRQALEAGEDLPPAAWLPLFGGLDEALGALGLTPIGRVGEALAFDPALHQAIGASPEAGAPVVVRHPGYHLDGRLQRRARVAPAEGA